MATIKETYVSFETAKLLKEKGFNEKLFTFYITDEVKKEGCFQLMAFTNDKIDNNHSDFCYLAPTQQMAMLYLRVVYNILISPKVVCFQGNKPSSKPYYKWIAEAISLPTGKVLHPDFWSVDYYDSYEEATDAEVKYCLENLI